MADTNKVVVYKGPGEVAVEEIDYLKLEVPEEVASAMGMTKEAPHAVILRIVSTNICGSDQHMVREGRRLLPDRRWDTRSRRGHREGQRRPVH